MLKRRIILLILCTIGILSITSCISLLRYFDPYAHVWLAIGLLVVCFLLAVTSVLGVMIYFFKKIYYRGEVGIYHILTSLRQSFFVALFSAGIVSLIAIDIPMLLPVLLLASSILFLELFIRNW